MAIPPVSREDLVQAMLAFDRGERSPHGPEPGKDWMGDRRYHYAILDEVGRPRYPVKEVIRLAVRRATGGWPGRFWGGQGANAYVQNRGFRVAPVPSPRAGNY